MYLIGDNYGSQNANFRVGRPTCSKIVVEVCDAIISVLGREAVHTPNTEREWLEVARRFQERWNMHHVLGAVDGKHIRIRNPGAQHGAYYNYKRFYSIILMAMVDADYRFTYFSCGHEGAGGDSTILNNSPLMESIEQGNDIFFF